MRSSVRSAVLAIAAAAAACAGCEKTTNQPVEPAQRAIGGGPPETMAADAVSRIASMRCDRELSCQNIGASAKYQTFEECVAVLKKDKSGFTASSCPTGVLDSGLSECLRAIRAEDCNKPLNTLARVAACRAENFCIQQVPGAPSVGVGSSPGG
jgi:uncharacterized protein DUF6184